MLPVNRHWHYLSSCTVLTTVVVYIAERKVQMSGHISFISPGNDTAGYSRITITVNAASISNAYGLARSTEAVLV